MTHVIPCILDFSRTLQPGVTGNWSPHHSMRKCDFLDDLVTYVMIEPQSSGENRRVKKVDGFVVLECLGKT